MVFYLSNQVSNESSELSGRFTKAILELVNMFDKLTPEQKEVIETIVRKLAHLSIYTVGGIIIMSHVWLYNISSKKKVLVSLGIGTCYAITDEIHQLFVPGRSGEIRDVCIDSLGVITGIIIFLVIYIIVKKICNLRKGE